MSSLALRIFTLPPSNPARVALCRIGQIVRFLDELVRAAAAVFGAPYAGAKGAS